MFTHVMDYIHTANSLLHATERVEGRINGQTFLNKAKISLLQLTSLRYLLVW